MDWKFSTLNKTQTTKTKTLASLIALLSWLGVITQAAPLGTAFTYQGQLADGGQPADGIYDLQYAIYDAATSGAQVGPTLTNTATVVSNGLFTVALDFGPGVFAGDARWLEIGVRTNGAAGAFTLLAPRQPLTPSPFALYAPNAGVAGSVPAAGIMGTLPPSSIAPGTITSAMLSSNAVSSLSAPDGSPANAVFVDTNGLVGVGTTDPGARFTVNGNTIVMGMLGVGTTNPGAGMYTKFDVVGKASFRTDTSTTTKALIIDQLGTAHRIYTDANTGTAYDLILGTYPNGHGDQLVLKQSGNVGIGRTPTANKLEVEGNASKTAPGSWLANSDVRIKQNIQTVTGATEKLARVRLVSFRYTDEYRRAHPSVEDRAYVNVVAQEFREVFPDHVQPSGESLPDGSEILQVDTYPLTIYSAAAVQELNQKLEERSRKQAARSQELEAKNAALERELAELKALVQALATKVNRGGQ